MKTIAALLVSLTAFTASAVELAKPVFCEPLPVANRLIKENGYKPAMTLKTETGAIVLYSDGKSVAIFEYFEEKPDVVCLIDVGQVVGGV